MGTQLGDEIKAFRRNHGYPLEQFADKIGCSRSYLSMLERGIDSRGNIPSPSQDILKRLAKVMNRPLADLQTLAEEKTPSIRDLRIHSKSEINRRQDRDSNSENSSSPEDYFYRKFKYLYEEAKNDSDDSVTSAYYKELLNSTNYLTGLSAEELRKVRMVCEILFKHTPEEREAQKRKDDLSEKEKYAEDLLFEDKQVWSALNCLKSISPDEYRKILDSCETVYAVKTNKYNEIQKFYDDMLKDLKKIIRERTVVSLG